jgi:hypothetical protein
LYERWSVGDDPSIAPTNIAKISQNSSDTFYQFPTNVSIDPYILFVHGWNMEAWDKDRFAETAFKRLYWQGYQGRFGVFHWPTEHTFKGLSSLATDPDEKDNFDRSEYQAWQSGTGLLNKLTDLNNQYPGHVYMLAHSMGNVTAGEALRLAGSHQVVNTYVASQAAISAHTYDPGVTNYSFSYPPFSSAPTTPNIYAGWFATNYGGGAGRIVSFYNTNDFALKRSVWQLDQLFKPDKSVWMGGSRWDYGYLGSATDPEPWTNFFKQRAPELETVHFDIYNVPTNRYEVMGLAAHSWTTALGATPPRGTPGALSNITATVYLGRGTPRIWPPDAVHPATPYDEHFFHSGQFRGIYWQQQGYWSELLGPEAFRIQP